MRGMVSGVLRSGGRALLRKAGASSRTPWEGCGECCRE